MSTADITSASNSRVKDVSKLQRQSSVRRETGLFCVEEVRLLSRALDAGFEIEALYVSDEHAETSVFARVTASGLEPVIVADEVMQKMTYRQNARQFVAVMRARTSALEVLERKLSLNDTPHLLVVCSGVEKPGNVGAILRSADAAGATGVILDKTDIDVFNPNCVRASTGAVFTVPVVCEEAKRVRAWCKTQGVSMVAAMPEAVDAYTAADYKGPTALIMGAEAEGLDMAWADAADHRVRVPMHGVVDSLNVSVTTALLLFEAARQRGRDAPPIEK